MELWRRRVDEALDALLAAAQDTDKLRLLWRETREAARSASVRVEAVLWE
jgi:hypothetical protein